MFEKRKDVNMKKRWILLIIIAVIFVGIMILPNILLGLTLSGTKSQNVSEETTESTETSDADDTETIGIPEYEISEEEQTSTADEEAIKEEYLATLAPADDEFDYLYANDYEAYDLVRLYKARDTKTYGKVLGIDKEITLKDIKEVLKTNDNISQEYKDFIIQYVTDWLALYPESDFTVLYYNLKTLRIDVVSEDEMMMETQSTDSAACYLRAENRILLLEGQDFSRETDNYIILTHELTHCARNVSHEDEDGTKQSILYYDHYLMGTYAEEGIITNIAYELQGITNIANFYPFQSSCYRIIMDCTGYDAEDFMNHSVNYLIDMMDDYMGDDQYAWYIVALIDAISTEKYTSYREVDFTNYQDLCDYMTKMYMKKYLPEGASLEEAEVIYDEYCDNIMYYFDQMKRPYPITEENFRISFEACLEERGIL